MTHSYTICLIHSEKLAANWPRYKRTPECGAALQNPSEQNKPTPKRDATLNKTKPCHTHDENEQNNITQREATLN